MIFFWGFTLENVPRGTVFHRDQESFLKIVHEYTVSKLCTQLAPMLTNSQSHTPTSTHKYTNTLLRRQSCEWSDIVTLTYTALPLCEFSQWIIVSSKSCLEDNPFPIIWTDTFRNEMPWGCPCQSPLCPTLSHPPSEEGGDLHTLSHTHFYFQYTHTHTHTHTHTPYLLPQSYYGHNCPIAFPIVLEHHPLTSSGLHPPYSWRRTTGLKI